MGLAVSAQIIRDLIVDGEYLVECIEHRDRGKVLVSFALRSRAQPYSIQIETTDSKLGGLFRAMLNEGPSGAGKPALRKVGGQSIPVVEVNDLPADASKGRKRRKQGGSDANGSRTPEAMEAETQSHSLTQQLALVPPEALKETAPVPKPSRRRRTARASAFEVTP